MSEPSDRNKDDHVIVLEAYHPNVLDKKNSSNNNNVLMWVVRSGQQLPDTFVCDIRWVWFFPCSGTGSLLLRTVHLLQTLKCTYPDLRLLVPGILYKLLHEHLTQEGSSGLTADTHILCWGYNDGLVQDNKEGSGEV